MLWLALEIKVLFEQNFPKIPNMQCSRFQLQIVCASSAPPPHCPLALPPACKPRSGTAISIETSVGEYTKRKEEGRKRDDDGGNMTECLGAKFYLVSLES